MGRKQTGRNRRGVSLSIDIDLADQLQGLSSRERAKIINALLRDNLANYIAGNRIDQSAGQVSMDEQWFRYIIRDEFNRLQISAVVEQSLANFASVDPVPEDTGLMDGFIGMRKK